MPHHQILSRLRSWPLEEINLEDTIILGRGNRVSKRDAQCAIVIELVDIFGSLVFLAGSVCFLPHLSRRLIIFLLGCGLFILGGLIYAGLSVFTLVETVRENGWRNYEACENFLYLVGSLIFLAGTILYWPEHAEYTNMEWVKAYSFGVYFNLFTPEFEATLLFIIGSLLFAMAAFVNGVSSGIRQSNRSEEDNQQGNQETGSRNDRGWEHISETFAGLLHATTSLYFAGSLLFVVGSVAFLPDYGFTEQMAAFGAWCYIIGSALFVFGGSVSLARVFRQMTRTPERFALLSAK